MCACLCNFMYICVCVYPRPYIAKSNNFFPFPSLYTPSPCCFPLLRNPSATSRITTFLSSSRTFKAIVLRKNQFCGLLHTASNRSMVVFVVIGLELVRSLLDTRLYCCYCCRLALLNCKSTTNNSSPLHTDHKNSFEATFLFGFDYFVFTSFARSFTSFTWFSFVASQIKFQTLRDRKV